MHVGSLCSGIDGLGKGLEMAGMDMAFHSEIDPYCCQELQREWPDIPNLGDIRGIDWKTVKAVDLICAGFPCQPASVAGKRKGTSDDRWLWPEVAQALRILRPEYAILENVPGLLTVNNGEAFSEIQSDLARLGYGCRWTCLRASQFGAPHRRKRLFIMAYADSKRLAQWQSKPSDSRQEFPSLERGSDKMGNADSERESQSQRIIPEKRGRSEHPSKAMGHTDRCGRDQGDPGTRRQEGIGAVDTSGQFPEAGSNPPGGLPNAWDSGIPIRGYDATIRFVEPTLVPLAHGVPGRADQIKALGNAVVPQVAEFVGNAIMRNRN